MESIQQIFLFVLCMTAVSKSSARIGFTGIDMTAAATDLPPSTPEMDNCREACQQKVQINEYSSFLSVSLCLSLCTYKLYTSERARRNIRFYNAENANGIGYIISKEINSFKKLFPNWRLEQCECEEKKQLVKTVFRKTRKIFACSNVDTLTRRLVHEDETEHCRCCVRASTLSVRSELHTDL